MRRGAKIEYISRSRLNVIVGSQVDGELTEVPVNTAAFKGEQVVLRCHSNVTEFNIPTVNWGYTTVAGTTQDVVSWCRVFEQLSSVYSLNVDEDNVTGQCDLVINKLQPSLTGLYTCSDSKIQQTAPANVTIIGQLFNIFLGLYVVLIITVVDNGSQMQIM